MSIEKLNRAAWAAGCAMAPPAELFDEAGPANTAKGWVGAKHAQQTPEPARSWLRDMFAGWSQKQPA